MQTNDEMKRRFQKEANPTKRVRFSEDTKNSSTFITLSKPHSAAVRKSWIQRCSNEDYDQLRKDLLSWQQKGLKLVDFFRKEGLTILDWAISYPNAKALRFICENISQELIKDTIMKDNFYLLNKFLLVEAGLETRGLTTRERLNNRLEKAGLLLMLGPEVQQYMGEKSSGVINESLKMGIETVVRQSLDAFKPQNDRIPHFL